MEELCADLADEHAELDRIVAGAELSTPTPAEGWTVADQLAHLWYFDEQAVLALVDPDAFAASVPALLESLGRGGPDPALHAAREFDADGLLVSWRAARQRLLSAAAAADPSARVPWYGPAMGLRSFVTARLMETWAHGQDVVDALGADREPTDRLRHVAHIGVGARAFSFAIHGREVPEEAIAVALTAPSGETWSWGPDDATNRVEGPAFDFCLAVTQRRHRDDTALRVTGPVATEWMEIAQAFAGPPGTGRAVGQFRR